MSHFISRRKNDFHTCTFFFSFLLVDETRKLVAMAIKASQND